MTSHLFRNLLVLTAGLGALIVAACKPPEPRHAPAAIKEPAAASSPTASAAADAEKTATADAASLVEADKMAVPTDIPTSEPASAKP